MRRTFTRSILSTAAASALVLAGTAAAQAVKGPEVIPLPDGFQPEGIASGTGNTVYAGSLADGDIVRADLRTGAVETVVDAPADRIAVGLKVSVRTNQLVVAGGESGMAYFYDADTGADVGTVQLTSGVSFVNDVALTKDGAWFTDSFQPHLYFVPVAADGSLGTAQTLDLFGKFTFVPGAFNLNGIAASPDGSRLIVANSSQAELLLVDPETVEVEAIDLGGATVPNADGILLDGKRLWVVQNFLNQVAEVRLAPDYRSGDVVSITTNDNFRIPTTVARQGNTLAVVNARFGVIPTPTEYEIVTFNR
jgi:sugar lactone lactonase YvrE